MINAVYPAWNVSSQDLGNWDHFCYSQYNLQYDDMSENFFHHYRDDIQRMSDMGLSSFQFSISWSRIMIWNAETRRMEPNPQGLTSYHALLDDMQAKALQPIATLYQFNLPLMLQTKLEPTGWLNPDIVTHFEDFAELAFREFGKKVKYWATFDEPLTFISGKYGSRDVVSGAKKPSDMNIYTVAHNVLLSHARAVAVFRALKGDERNVIAAGARIGIMLSTEFGYPLDESDALNAEAVELEMQFSLGWLFNADCYW
ncbi:unnamed protein product [Peronospora belbahrii]|uniref:Beta-glucosidase n=1 Tax=Peronospora belbahrii TaxID=622444 RepID=A0AAU9L0P1_9STRA|nr:unnamed protein product [Peronospora belbahrii]